MGGGTTVFNLASGLSETVPGVTVDNGGSITGAGVITSTSAYDIRSGSVAATLAGNVGLNKTTSVTAALSGSNTYSGATNVTAGSLNLSNQNAVQNSTVTMGGNATSSVGLVFDQSVSGHAFNFGSLAAASAGNGNDIVLQDNATTPNFVALTVGSNNASTTYAANLSGGGSLTKSGTGTLVFAGTNSYTGVTNITAGTLQFSSKAALYNGNTASWTTTNLVVNSGATAAFGVGGNGDFGVGDIDAIKALATSSGGFKSGANLGLDTTDAGGNFIYNSAITNTNGNTLGLTKLGAGALTLGGANRYSGPTNVGAGTLQAGIATQAFGSNSAVTIANNVTTPATLSLNGYDETIGSLSGYGSVALGSHLLTVGGLNSNTTYAGTIGGSGGQLTKVGTGMLTLANTNTFSGLTTVSNGMLRLAAANALSGNIYVGASGKLNLGVSNAINSSSLNVELNGGVLSTLAAAQSMGALNISAASIIDFGTNGVASETLRFDSLVGGSQAFAVNNWTSQDHLVFTSNTNLDTGYLASIQFGGFKYTGASLTAFSGGGYEISPSNLTPVPEPTTVLGALALLGFVGWRERRRISAILGQLKATA